MQISHASRRLLLPAKPWFVLASLAGAFVLNLLPLGPLPGIPDWVALVLCFWCIREPMRVGMGMGFLLGVFMDVAHASVMGQHVLAYVLLTFGATMLSKRVLWFPYRQQAVHVFALLLIAQIAVVLARLAGGADFPGFSIFLSALTGAILWRPLSFVLLLPQYQPVEKDENRPI